MFPVCSHTNGDFLQPAELSLLSLPLFNTNRRCSLFFFSPSSSPPLSPHPGAGGAGRPVWENPEDHRLRPGQRVASDHQDERGGDVRLDGPGGHQAFPLLQEQRCVEVKTLKTQTVSTSVTSQLNRGHIIYKK